MQHFLPTGGFSWIPEKHLLNVRIDDLPDEFDEGYIFEVSPEYPEEVHEKHKDLPFCPEHGAPPGKNHQKLLTTLWDKEKYVIHYGYLKQVLRNGLKLKKVHRGLRFNQSAWLKQYIDLNSGLRKKADNQFAKDLYKLMNNAIFGK